jgi:hypothetical protein
VVYLVVGVALALKCLKADLAWVTQVAETGEKGVERMAKRNSVKVVEREVSDGSGRLRRVPIMNAGTDYNKAKRQALANANSTQTPRWLHVYGRSWWISQTPIFGAERIEPTTYQTSEQCQYCGTRWQQTRTLGTPRLDSVPCPNCKRLV